MTRDIGYQKRPVRLKECQEARSLLRNETGRSSLYARGLSKRLKINTRAKECVGGNFYYARESTRDWECYEWRRKVYPITENLIMGCE